MPVIERLRAREILDSRGRPTVKAWCRLASGVEAAASVPSGASTGAAEACELRDGDAARHRGLGCRRAAANVEGEIQRALKGRDFPADAAGQERLDQAMIALDGTPNKARLGANAILAVSLAFARAVALERGQPLYRHFAELLGTPARRMPQLTVNLFSGGKHAGGQVAIQDVLVVPIAARTVDDSLAAVTAVYHAASEQLKSKYRQRVLRADEGGLAPPAQGAEALIDDAIAAIGDARLAPGKDVSLAIDVASSHFFADGRYRLDSLDLDGPGMVERMGQWARRWPIVSLEDGLAEDDWPHWPRLRAALGGRCATLGDDFLCTNPERIRRAIDAGAADALLLKVNQIGSLSEAAAACRLARGAKWRVTVSARSGETEDDWLADLAVGWSADWIKIGSITQSERLAKYNRLLEIEAAEGWKIG
jgi:enolase